MIKLQNLKILIGQEHSQIFNDATSGSVLFDLSAKQFYSVWFTKNNKKYKKYRLIFLTMAGNYWLNLSYCSILPYYC